MGSLPLALDYPYYRQPNSANANRMAKSPPTLPSAEAWHPWHLAPTNFVVDKFKNWTAGMHISMKCSDVEELYATPPSAQITIRNKSVGFRKSPTAFIQCAGSTPSKDSWAASLINLELLCAGGSAANRVQLRTSTNGSRARILEQHRALQMSSIFCRAGSPSHKIPFCTPIQKLVREPKGCYGNPSKRSA